MTWGPFFLLLKKYKTCNVSNCDVEPGYVSWTAPGTVTKGISIQTKI